MDRTEFIAKAVNHIRSLETAMQEGSDCAMYDLDEFLGDMMNAIPELENEFDLIERAGKYTMPDWWIFREAVKHLNIPDWVMKA